MNNFNSDCLSDFVKCKSIWFQFLTELNWNPSAINPLELVPESFWPEVTDLLIKLDILVKAGIIILESLINIWII